MKLSDSTVEELLLENNRISSAELEKLVLEAKKNHHSLQEVILSNEIVSEREFTELYAKYADIPFVDIDPKIVEKPVLERLPEKTARQYNAVVFQTNDDRISLAMEDPDDVQGFDFLSKELHGQIDLFVATKSNILQVLENYRDGAVDEINDVIAVQERSEQKEEVRTEDIAEDSPIAKTVNLLLEFAIRSNASDVHIEPREDFVQIRYRIDGVLKEVNRLPRNVINALVSRIKILSNLKIDERRVPQDGRFKVTVAGKRYALRVSTLPTSDGEKVVMRILDESNKALTLEQLGYWGWSLEKINNAIKEPNGMILVTGPTGSGKSTSLYSALTLLNKPDVNISTIEDPIEYKIVGANQTQVNPTACMTFIAGLRALLRQDPNIIMVGEIRDSETANLGVQAALTGHLVFSTLHTNNAATCLPRLLDMGIEPFLIASTIRVVVGQRLVRRLCGTCKQSFKPSDEERKNIEKLFGLSDAGSFKRLHELETKAKSQAIGNDISDLSSSESAINRLFRPHPEGCDDCKHIGYKGRMGIYEVLANSNEVQKLIISNATSNMIQDEAVREGMMTMQTDGFVKALRGQTSIEEILRVTRE